MTAARPEQLMSSESTILVINCGSSSVKFALFVNDASLTHRLAGAVEGIGLASSRMRLIASNGQPLADVALPAADHRAALSAIVEAAPVHMGGAQLVAVGHRVVHGGDECDCSLPVTDDLERRLTALIPLAPLHLPHNLAGIAAIKAVRPDIPQFASFDTAFHHTLPPVARAYALPRELQRAGIRRYGFHGLSYEYVVGELQFQGVDIEHECMIVAHLGNGSSMCALRGGRSIDTTMGFSTLAGLVMGSRVGDLDPGAVIYLQATMGLSHADVQALLYRRSGLLGVSGMTSDMRELLARKSETAAQEAIDLFCYRARHYLAALTAALGGLDRVVFTGGIGANAPEIRETICTGLGYLGIALDDDANYAGKAIISDDKSSVVVQALVSNEEVMIARHVRQLTRCSEI